MADKRREVLAPKRVPKDKYEENLEKEMGEKKILSEMSPKEKEAYDKMLSERKKAYLYMLKQRKEAIEKAKRNGKQARMDLDVAGNLFG